MLYIFQECMRENSVIRNVDKQNLNRLSEPRAISCVTRHFYKRNNRSTWWKNPDLNFPFQVIFFLQIMASQGRIIENN